MYTLVDKCALVEEGRRLPGEEDGFDIDSEDNDESNNLKKKNKRRKKKRKDKTVMTVEGSSTPSTSCRSSKADNRKGGRYGEARSQLW